MPKVIVRTTQKASWTSDSLEKAALALLHGMHGSQKITPYDVASLVKKAFT